MNFVHCVVGVTFLILVNSVMATDYCRADLCKKGDTHVGCRNNGGWGSACKDPKQYQLTESDKEFILDLHNQHRQEVASGALSRYQPAANMREVTWNDELAKVACFNAKSCVFAHDNCRNTDDHPYSGQNLAITGSTAGYKPFREAYKDLHTQWYVEHNFCGMANIRNYQNKPSDPKEQIGHFTQMVSDNVDQVGCCVTMFEKYDEKKGKWMKMVYIVCNYSYISMKDRAIYVEGTPSCKKFSKKYNCLCVDLPQNIPGQNTPGQNIPVQTMPVQTMPVQTMPVQNFPTQNYFGQNTMYRNTKTFSWG